MPRKKKTTVILDTNVILHDSGCIRHFGEYDVIIPITVLEELDQFKKGGEILNFHAREFIRTLDLLCGEHLFNGGVPIGPGLGKITVKLDREFHKDLALSFSESRSDHHILNIAYCLAKENPSTQVILITKDVNLRIKAKSVSIIAQDYKSDQIKDVETLYTGKCLIENVSGSVLQKLHEPPFESDPSELPLEKEPVANEYFILRNENKSALAMYDFFSQKIRRIDKNPAFGIMPRNAEQTFALDALTKNNIQLVTLSGKAGTGKTLLALAAALQCKKITARFFWQDRLFRLAIKTLVFCREIFNPNWIRTCNPCLII